MWYLFLIPVLSLLLLLLIAPVTVRINYILNEKGDMVPNTTLIFSSPGTGVRLSFLWGLINVDLRLSSIRLVFGKFAPVFKLRVKLAKRSGCVLDRGKTSVPAGRVIDLYQQVMNIYRAIKPAFRYMLSTVKLHRLSWCTKLGMYQADQTGLAVGLLWTLKSSSIAYLYRRLKKPLPRPDLEIVPVFDARVLAIRLNCMFSLRSWHMIITGVMAVWFYLKNR